MTDSPGLPPEQERVRRLLADARHEGPVPPEVVARLDETLASLVSERAGAPLETSGPSHDDSSPVVDLGARRRRRMAGVGLLAAAAVVVAGVAIGQALPRTSGGDSASDSGGAAAGSGGTERSFGGESDGQSDDSGADSSSGAEAPGSLKSVAPTPLAGLPAVSLSDPDLADRLLALRGDAVSRSTGQPLTPDVQGTCLMRGIGPGRRLLAQVDGQPGTVVYQPPSGAAQGVAIYVCGSGEPVRTLTLPAP